MSGTAPTQELPFGITLIDTGYFRPRHAASFLLTEGDSAAFIEVGVALSTPRLLAALEAKGMSPEQVAYVIPTHVHLDHAGGAGSLMAALPHAKLVIHPRGARHMKDPSKLIAGAAEVYGEEAMASSFGTVVPVPEERVIEAPDGFQVELNQRTLRFLDTPGHARHHFVVHDERSRGVFTGDIFGIAYEQLDGPQGRFVLPTTSPVQFDPQAMHDSIERVLACGPERVFLTHFGMIEDPGSVAQELHQLIDGSCAIAKQTAGKPSQRQALVAGLSELLLGRARERGCGTSDTHRREVLTPDIELNAQGLTVWLEKEAEAWRKPTPGSSHNLLS